MNEEQCDELIGIYRDIEEAHEIMDRLGSPEVEEKGSVGLLKRLRRISAIMINTDTDINETRIWKLR